MVQCKPLPSKEFLHQCFLYNKKTGSLTWKMRPLEHFNGYHDMNGWNKRFAGKPAGAVGKRGHLFIRIFAGSYYAHRIIWKLVTGEDPIEQVDHKNGKKTDNRWKNLREATNQQNHFNMVVHKDSLTGLKGVTFLTKQKKFIAQIKAGRTTKFLGNFDTASEAHEAYQRAAMELHGDFANFGLSGTQAS